MSRSNALYRMQRAGYLSALSVWILSACSPCHTSHTEVSYHEPYQTQEEFCTQIDDIKVCVPYWENHPAECSATVVCDLRCEVLDKGKAEAHAKHQVLNLYGDKVDPRCNWQGAKAWPK